MSCLPQATFIMIPKLQQDPEGMKQVIATYQNAFSGAHWEVLDTIVSGDQIVTRWQGSGIHEKELNGIPGTGKSARVDGVWIHRFANGKIVESWNVWDTLGLLQQLGVVPMTEEHADASPVANN